MPSRKSILLLLLLLKFYNVYYTTNNSCDSFLDYLLIDSSENCYENPDIDKNTPEILSRLVGFYENHTVLTSDGYFLDVFRLPQREPKGVIILQHPVTIDAVVWVGQSDTSIGYQLWRMGYEIWLPNQRGTFYSNKHENYTLKDFEFWDFTFEDIGMYDYDAVIKHVAKLTGRNDLIFIGHSMATTASLAYASLKPEEADKHVRIFIEICPVTSLTHMTSHISKIKYILPYIIKVSHKLGVYHAFKNDGAWSAIFTLGRYFPFKKLFIHMLNLMMGFSEDEFDPRWYTALFSQMPRAFSLKLANHYMQLHTNGFRRYDYGPEGNLEKYNSIIPPEYPVWNIKTPVYLITSLKDTIATVQDSEVLYGKLSDSAKIYGRNITDVINHIEFHFGKHKVKYAFEPIFEILGKL